MRAHLVPAASACLAALALIAGCGSSSVVPPLHDGGVADAAEVDAATGPVAGADAMVTAFDKTHLYFTGTDNQRQVDAPVSFPVAGAYQKIILHLSLACPSGGCDPWDRFASLGVVTGKGTGGGPDTVLEVARFITPYHVGAKWDLDVTDLRPLLTGDLTMRAFIDTWVGPGSSYGAGWLVTATFEMTGGIPVPLPIAVLPVWTPRAVTYGDPAKPVAGGAPPQKVTGRATPRTAPSSAARRTRSRSGARPTHRRSGGPTAPPRRRPINRAPISTRARAGAPART